MNARTALPAAPTPPRRPQRATMNRSLLLPRRFGATVTALATVTAGLVLAAPSAVAVTRATVPDASLTLTGTPPAGQDRTEYLFALEFERERDDQAVNLTLTSPDGNLDDVTISVDPPGDLATYTVPNTASSTSTTHTVQVPIQNLPRTGGFALATAPEGLWDVNLTRAGETHRFAQLTFPVVESKPVATEHLHVWNHDRRVLVGETLDPGTTTWVPRPVTVTHQWHRVSLTGTTTPIDGATSATYVPTVDDQDAALFRRDTATTSALTFLGATYLPATVDTRHYWVGAHTLIEKPHFDNDTRTLTLPDLRTPDGQPFTWTLYGRATTPGPVVLTTPEVTVAVKAPPGHAAVPADGSLFPWTLNVTRKTTPPAPEPSTRPGYIDIPSAVDVEYRVNGATVAAGEAGPYTGAVTVVALSTSRLVTVTGKSRWEMRMRRTMRPPAPTFDTDALTVTIPDRPGVWYLMNGTHITPGVHTITPTTLQETGTEPYAHRIHADDVTITARRLGDTDLIGTTTWTHRFTRTELTHTRPDVAHGERLVLPPFPGYRFLLDGQPFPAEGVVVDNTTRVEIRPDSARYAIASQPVWSYAPRDHVPEAPTSRWLENALDIPDSDVVRYLVNGQTVPAGRWHHQFGKDPETVTVTVVPIHPELTLDHSPRWTFSFYAVRIAPLVDGTTSTFQTHPALTYYVDDVLDTEHSGKAQGSQFTVAPKPGGVRRVRVESENRGIQLNQSTFVLDERILVDTTDVTFHSEHLTYTATAPTPVLDAASGLLIPPYTLQLVDADDDVHLLPFGTHALPDSVVGRAFTVHAVASLPDTHRINPSDTARWVGGPWNGAQRLTQPQAPTINGTTVTIPPGVGYGYRVNGVAVAHGIRTARVGSVITAVPHLSIARFSQGAVTSWTVNPPQTVPVTVAAPTVTATGYEIPPARAGITYYANDVAVAPGTHTSRRITRFDARATDPRLLIVGAKKWTADLRTPVIPPTPGFNLTAREMTVPQSTLFEYLVDGTPVPPGTWPLNGGELISARLLDDEEHRIADRAQYTWYIDVPAGATGAAAGRRLVLTRPAVAPSSALVVGPDETLLRRDGVTQRTRATRPVWAGRKIRLTASPGLRYRVVITGPAPKSGKLTATRRVVRFDTRVAGRTRTVAVGKRQKAVVTAVARDGHRVVGKKRWVMRR